MSDSITPEQDAPNDGMTRRETPAGDDSPTRRETAVGGGPVTAPGPRRLNLPAAVTADYEYLGDRSSGGEADIALLRDRRSSEEVISRPPFSWAKRSLSSAACPVTVGHAMLVPSISE